MRVMVYPADRGGCGHYRLIWPGTALANQGADVEVVWPDDGPDTHLLAEFHDLAGEPTPFKVQDIDADVVVLQRPLEKYLSMLIPLIQKQGIKVVVELDDLFHAINPRNKAWAATHPQRSPKRNINWLEAAIRAADLVTVSTTKLRDFYGKWNSNIVVIRNVVPEHYLTIEREPNDVPVVGWSGVLDTHPDDLQVVGPAVAKAVRRTGAQVAVVGDGRGFNRVLGLGHHGTRVSGWVPLVKYPQAMSQIDVGIVPLEMSEFNHAKSWLKGLEFASLGVPFVATPTDEYHKLFSWGIGEVASNPQQWLGCLMDRLTDKAFRECEGEQTRDWVRTQGLTVEAQCNLWWDAWSMVVA